MIVKSQIIEELIRDLRLALPQLELELVDYWDADDYSVGVTTARDRSRLVYVSRPPLSAHFYFECEAGAAGAVYITTKKGSVDSARTLAPIIKQHLSPT